MRAAPRRAQRVFRLPRFRLPRFRLHCFPSALARPIIQNGFALRLTGTEIDLPSLPVGPELIERAIRLRQDLGAAGGLPAAGRFAAQRGLTRADRDLIADWAANHVRGVFEIRSIARRDSAGRAVIAL